MSWFNTDLFLHALTFIVPAAHVIGLLSAFDAVMHARTPQGSAAWALALLAFPLLALPLYWLFGRSRYIDYVEAIREIEGRVEDELADSRNNMLRDFLLPPHDQRHQNQQQCDGQPARRDPRAEIAKGDERGELEGFQALAKFPLTRGNGARLLINGKETFDAMFAAIDAAESYVLVQFYILRDDALGARLQQALLAKARQGVRAFVLFDDVGSFGLSRRYRRELEEGGIAVSGFHGQKGWFGRFRINFRNHRKIVVVDGRVGFVGGFNVGDEYLGGDPEIGAWRDTHVRVEGPVVQALQLSFLKDWHFSTDEMPALDWNPVKCAEDRVALVLASGPNDRLETCSLLFAHAIASAERRIWIATPYFVPDAGVFSALKIAALRGVDVRVLVPRRSDNLLFRFAPYAYLPDAREVGVNIYFYEAGFMHQKVFLIDDDYAAISSANFDNRSFRLNFEITALLADYAFAQDVAAMLKRDFTRATRAQGTEWHNRSFFFRLAVRITRLFAPVL
ncbi:MAG: cardiolipin synthase [Burkholderiales bacterium]|nr:cardiolipin synthase [Pseudomonadota bacterium]